MSGVYPAVTSDVNSRVVEVQSLSVKEDSDENTRSREPANRFLRAELSWISSVQGGVTD